MNYNMIINVFFYIILYQFLSINKFINQDCQKYKKLLNYCKLIYK